MKILYIFVVLVFTGISNLQAQDHSDKIDIEKGYKYHEIYLDRDEIKTLLKKDEQAYALFKPSRFTYTVSDLLITAGITSIFAPLRAKVDNNDDTNATNVGTFIGIGIGLVAVAIPIKIKSNRQTKAAVELYNSRLSSNLHQQPKPEFLLGFTGSGPGMTIKF